MNSVTESHPIPIGEHTLPSLPYTYDAFEPFISTETMRIHYDKLHRGYVDRFNQAEIALREARNTGDYSLIKYWEDQLVFNGAGDYLHILWWKSISPHKTVVREPLANDINLAFGSMNKFKQQFSAAAKKVEASGWAMLVWSPRSWRIDIIQVEKHQNGTLQDCIPLLVLDVWEHAYFLQYLNRRDEYVDMFWNIINWESANHRLSQAKKLKWKPF